MEKQDFFKIENMSQIKEKTIEERAKAYASGKFDEISSTAGYIKGATKQKAIDKKILNEIYSLYSQLEDDLYDGYLNSNWNGGMVTINNEEHSMGEMLDKLRIMFHKAMEE